MAAYLYQSNVSLRDTFQQLTLRLDNGATVTLRLGQAYDLTAGEAARARQHIVLVPTSQVTAPPVVVALLPVVGTLTDGDVPVWDSSLAAFVPGAGGGGGGGGNQVLVWNEGTSQYEADPDAREFRGPVDPSTTGDNPVFADVWTPTEEPA